MDMNARDRDFYEVTLATLPPEGDWWLSFDGGATWHAGTVVEEQPGRNRWLVHGPDFPTGDGIPSILAPYSGVVPLLQTRGTGVVVSRNGPAVFFV